MFKNYFKINFIIIVIFLSKIILGQSEGIINNGNTKIHYRTFGQGVPVLIINGGPGMNSDGFVDPAVHLSKDYKTIIYDQRGTGKSFINNPDSVNITMKLMLEDIECLRKYLKIKSWVILGHSFGGMLASYYASFYPGHVKAMILSSSGGINLDLLKYGNFISSRLSKEELDTLEYWGNKIENGDTSYFAKLQRGKALAAAYVYDKKNIPTIAERLTQRTPIITNLVWENLKRIKFDCTKQLSSFDKPVLIIQGKEDIVNKNIALKEHEVFKNSKLVLIDNCVHYGWLDNPKEYFSEINKFLQSI
jgi:proline iminopeptidase